MKNFLLLILFILSSCHYKSDKLKIINNSDKKICYDILIKNKLDKDYHFISAVGIVDPKKHHSPIVRSDILYELETESIDSTLYIIYFEEKDWDLVFQKNNIILSEKFRIDKYTIKDLNNSNWVISYK